MSAPDGTHRTRDGGPVRLRPLGRDDRWVVTEVFAGLSPHSRLLRYHAPITRLTPAMLDRLAAVDGDAHVAVAAEVPGHEGWTPVGVARLVRTGPGRGELAVEVVDRWHGQGLGRLLLEDLRERASRAGYAEISGSVLVGNDRMLALLRSVFPGASVDRDAETWEVRAPVPLPASGRPRSSRPARRSRGQRPRRRRSSRRPPAWASMPTGPGVGRTRHAI